VHEGLPRSSDIRASICAADEKNCQNGAQPIGSLIAPPRVKARRRRNTWRVKRVEWAETRRVHCYSIARPWDLGRWGQWLRRQLGRGLIAETVVTWLAWVYAAERLGGQYYGSHRESAALCGVGRTTMAHATRLAIRVGLVEQRPDFIPLTKHQNREATPTYVLTDAARDLMRLGAEALARKKLNDSIGCRVTTSGEIHTQNSQSRSRRSRLRRCSSGREDLAHLLVKAVDRVVEAVASDAAQRLREEACKKDSYLPTSGPGLRAAAAEVLAGRPPPTQRLDDLPAFARDFYRRHMARFDAQGGV